MFKISKNKCLKIRNKKNTRIKIQKCTIRSRLEPTRPSPKLHTEPLHHCSGHSM